MDTDVLIIGAGPSGLMMACQLLRFGIQFRIIDKQSDRVHESRAFAIQAKSMEIFQNLGFVDEFLKCARSTIDVVFFINGKKQIDVHFDQFKHQDTPFPSVYFLPQSETERIFIEFLEQHGVTIERQKELVTLTQTHQRVCATIKNNVTGSREKIVCAYSIGCDGAQSDVRHGLNFSFEGNTYAQSFYLVDATVEWPYPRNKFIFFLEKKGIVVHIPLTKRISRMMFAKRSTSCNEAKPERPSVHALEKWARTLIQAPVKFLDPMWISHFRLHHRGASRYYQNRVFLVGDAAHIHSPVGGQGMNTGLQDATNLAWKLAFVVKKNTDIKLLATYETERHPIGKILLKTTDRFFSFLTAKGFIVRQLQNGLLPFVIRFLFSKKNLEKCVFRFISQLNIHYSQNEFTIEINEAEYPAFKSGPSPGYRAPNAPVNTTSLFLLLRHKPFNVLFFYTQKKSEMCLKKINFVVKDYEDLVGVHAFRLSSANKLLFKRYGVVSSAIYVIRPDGYVGFRVNSDHYSQVEHYLSRFFK
ncbi:hypothetical protein BEV13_05030 [Rickettsiella grylli]|uniref:FAD-dependent monooxygenase n=1 Tax=Rickettsiella grylli TaxID=59196 RepID=UPI0008FD9439|nr:FAD-dependent monooxygenase [Rickettsiella grylli]OIZ99772.1 hypothetical protein BEV13_05030 [Rickettsiella grylli]